MASLVLVWSRFIIIAIAMVPMLSHHFFPSSSVVTRATPILVTSWHRFFKPRHTYQNLHTLLSRRGGGAGARLGEQDTSKSSSSFKPTPATMTAANTSRSLHDTALPMQHRVFVAVGSNLGDRFQNIANALKLLCNDTSTTTKRTQLVRTSFLYETEPMYVTDQPSFLNGAIEIQTDLLPHELLQRLKDIEHEIGRDFSRIRNGPRLVDLDILFYETIEANDHDSSSKNNNQHNYQDYNRPTSSIIIDTPELIIPHPRIPERQFVLGPLQDVAGPDHRHPKLNKTIGDLYMELDSNHKTDGTRNGAVRVLPLPNGRMLEFNETIIMGILNVTPDSFSDGGKWNASINDAVNRAMQMEAEGARIIDIGGESTRPGAKEIPVEEQINRTYNIIQRIRQVSNIAISIDTRHSKVARAAIEAGADIVNDVSGGMFDPNMFSTVAEFGVPIVLMHMRGTPESMQSMTKYEDVVYDVIQHLKDRSNAAEEAGIPKWLQIIDPGIGFAKDINGNLLLLQNIATIRSQLGNIPILLGTSRKGFLGKLTGETIAENRDVSTVASCITALCLEGSCSSSSNGQETYSNIIRVHNVKSMKEGAVVMDAIRNIQK